MKSIRKLAYFALLTLSVFSITPTLAAAQEARGSFTLTHDVRWQDIDVSAGEYEFSLNPMGASQLLLLRKADGKGTGYMLLVHNTEAAESSDCRLPFLRRRSRSSAPVRREGVSQPLASAGAGRPARPSRRSGRPDSHAWSLGGRAVLG